MKRFLALIILVFGLVGMMSASIYADEAAPTVGTYEAVVINPNGAQDKYNDIKLDYGTKIQVSFDLLGYDYITGSIEGGESVSIKREDIQLLDEEVEMDIDTAETYALKILDQEGVKIHKGPTRSHSQIGTIPYGSDVIGYKYDDYIPWCYVEYNGVKGWICELNGAVGKIKNEFSRYLTSTEITMYKQGDCEEEMIVIPANSELRSNISLYHAGEGSRGTMFGYVKYNDIWGYIYTGAIGIENFEKYKVLNEGTKLFESVNIDFYYEDIIENRKVLVDNIPIGTELSAEYDNNWSFAYEADGPWIYTIYKGKKGWVYIGEETVNDTLVTNEKTDEKEIENIKEENVKKDNKETSPEKKEKQEGLRLTSIQFIIICIGVAVIIALTAIVTIALVNKKNKANKKDDSTESEKEN